jgi:hypothetical protein
VKAGTSVPVNDSPVLSPGNKSFGGDMEPINKHSVLKEARTRGEWKGYIAPSNVNSYHIVGGWHLGMSITIVFLDGKYTVRDTALEDYLSEFVWYNCQDNETGKRIRFWK